MEKVQGMGSSADWYPSTNKTPKEYFNMPERVFRNGAWVDIRDNNARIFGRTRKSRNP